MKTNRNTGYTVSRRRLLAGLGTVGAASAGAGLGTTAYFTDTETLRGVIGAGALDTRLDWQQTYVGPSGVEYVNAFPDRTTNGPGTAGSGTSGSGTVSTADATSDEPDGIQDPIESRDDVADRLYGRTYADLNLVDRTNAEGTYRAQFADSPSFAVTGPIIDLDDVKPGDSGAVSYSVHQFDEPGYVWLKAGLREHGEGTVTEPELAAGDEDDTGDGSSDGELLGAVRVQLWYDDGDSVVEPDESPPERDLIFEGSLATMLTDSTNGLAAGIPLDGAPDSPERECFPADVPGDEQVRHVGFRWWLPTSVGNEVQGDRVTFDLVFASEQCRHNDGSANPFASA